MIQIVQTSQPLRLAMVCCIILASLLAAIPSRGYGQSVPQPLATPASSPVQLVDITSQTGIHFTHLSSPESKYIVESMSGGVALLDFDGDGWLDIYFTNAPSVAMALAGQKARSALYRNNHDGTFTDVAEKAGVATPCWAMGVAAGDYNNDGLPDLAISCFGGVILYRNNGNGTFTDVTKEAGLDKDKGWATGITFGDFDGDGYSDLFVSHYVDLDMQDLPLFGSKETCLYKELPVQCGPRGLKGLPDALYHNRGDGTFTDVSHAAGVDDPKHYFGLTAVWSDFDNDGKLDLFVANDGEPNFLYHNEGGGHFRDVALDAGVALNEDGIEQANMGVALGDIRNNGRFSILVSHFSDEFATLYSNDQSLSFTDISHSSTIAAGTVPYVGWGDAFLDLDNSGWQDILLVNGHVYPQVDGLRSTVVYREPKLVFRNNHNGTFTDVSANSGAAILVPQVSRGLAVGDLFHSGRLDMVVENLVGSPMVLESCANQQHHWLSIALEGSPRNRLGLNARVRVTAGAQVQLGEVRSGSSYLSQNDLRLHFGLGDAAVVSKLEIEWPGGGVQTFLNVKSDNFYQVKQGGTLVPLTYVAPQLSMRCGRSPQ